MSAELDPIISGVLELPDGVVGLLEEKLGAVGPVLSCLYVVSVVHEVAFDNES